TLKQGLLVFWALWLTVVFLGNLCDLLKRLRVLNPGWKFASGNYDLMKKTTAVYHLSDTVVLLLLIGVVIWEGVAAVLMWSAAFTLASSGLGGVYSAFAFSLALWAAFMVADELFIAYETEPIHTGIFIAQAASLLLLCLLPSA
ncbi:MAG TPA: hypothetical protein VHD90_04970, partial [Phototrophicaceae bacterium]|nr:hypothetical protein [Phototrophicaceae bacterium]